MGEAGGGTKYISLELRKLQTATVEFNDLLSFVFGVLGDLVRVWTCCYGRRVRFLQSLSSSSLGIYIQV